MGTNECNIARSGRKKSRCLRFKEDPLPRESRAPFLPEKISRTRYSRKYHLRIRLERERGIEFLLSLALVNEKVNEESRGGESRDLL